MGLGVLDACETQERSMLVAATERACKTEKEPGIPRVCSGVNWVDRRVDGGESSLFLVAYR